MFEKVKNLANIFSKITVCVLFVSAIYISALWGLDAQISVRILWQIIIVSAVCAVPILMYPTKNEKELSKKGMIVRQIIYFVYVNIAVLGLGRAFGWFYFEKPEMVVFMEGLIIGVYVIVNLGVYMNDRIAADSMNRKLSELRKIKGEKFERKTFKLLIGGSTASNACSMQGYKKMENNIIKISHLHKSFGEVKAVNDLSFQVKKGELFAFLGVNGAGKSTTISIICGQLKKDSGTVQINENDIEKTGKKVGRTLGVVFQDSVLDKPLTVRESLKSRAALYGITGKAFEERLKELVNILDFGDYLNRPVGKLSGGQRRRIDIARALLHRPEVLILDEPTTGLDPQTRLLIWNVIDKLRADEKLTVFLTTHYMEEAANADYVVILDKGSIAAEGTPFELKNKYVQDTMSIYGVTEAQIKSLGIEYEEIRDGYRVRVKNTSEATELIVAHQELFYDYEVTKGGMDDVFLAVTGKRLGGEN